MLLWIWIVRDRVAFKRIVTVHRCLNGSAPNYLLNHVIPVSAIVSRQRLRSAQQNTLVVPRYRLITYGRRAFSVAGPTAWNSLPVAFRDPTISNACFRRHLKTVVFAQQHNSVGTIVFSACEICYDYALYKFTFIIITERRPRLLQMRRAGVDPYRLPAGLTAANLPHAAAAVDRRDRQTDGHRTVTQTCSTLCVQCQ